MAITFQTVDIVNSSNNTTPLEDEKISARVHKINENLRKSMKKIAFKEFEAMKSKSLHTKRKT